MRKTSRFPILVAFSVLSVACLARRAAAADTVVQVPVDGLIDGRTVSTIAGGTITPWSANQGVDGDGNADGFVTNAVETALVPMNKTVGGKAGVALPDDGMFPANTRHPAVVLHFSNAAPITSPQTHQIYIAASRGAQMFQFDVPQATYSKMFLFITASEGGAALTITLNYAGGAASTMKQYMLPDYGIGGAGANDPVFFNLIAGMRKWGSSDNEGDSTTHTITGIEINPSATDMLTSIKVQKTNGSHCVFWGATGIATSAVTTGTGGGSGTTDGGAAGAMGTDAGGTAGAGGSTGAGGSGGVTGAAGSTTTGAAGSTTTGAAGSTTTGAAGSTTTGVAGSTTGAAGSTTTGAAGVTGTSTGAAGTAGTKRASSGGCALAGQASRHEAAWMMLLVAFGLLLRRRRNS